MRPDGMTRRLRAIAARGGEVVRVTTLIRHHKVTMPGHVPAGLRPNHTGGALRCPARTAYDRGERATCPLSLYLSRPAVAGAIVFLDADPRPVLAAEGIGKTAREQRRIIHRAAHGRIG